MERYRRLFETAKDGVVILDAASGMILEVNPRMAEIAGRPISEIARKRIWEAPMFDADNLGRRIFEAVAERGPRTRGGGSLRERRAYPDRTALQPLRGRQNRSHSVQ